MNPIAKIQAAFRNPETYPYFLSKNSLDRFRSLHIVVLADACLSLSFLLIIVVKLKWIVALPDWLVTCAFGYLVIHAFFMLFLTNAYALNIYRNYWRTIPVDLLSFVTASKRPQKRLFPTEITEDETQEILQGVRQAIQEKNKSAQSLLIECRDMTLTHYSFKQMTLGQKSLYLAYILGGTLMVVYGIAVICGVGAPDPQTVHRTSRDVVIENFTLGVMSIIGGGVGFLSASVSKTRMESRSKKALNEFMKEIKA